MCVSVCVCVWVSVYVCVCVCVCVCVSVCLCVCTCVHAPMEVGTGNVKAVVGYLTQAQGSEFMFFGRAANTLNS